MTTSKAIIDAKIKALNAKGDQAWKAYDSGRISLTEYNSLVDECEAEELGVNNLIRRNNTKTKARQFAGNDGEIFGSGDDGGYGFGRRTKAAPGCASPTTNDLSTNVLAIPESGWEAMFKSCQNRQPFAMNVASPSWKTKAMADRDDVRSKAAPIFTLEGASQSLLPAELIPQAFQLRYESDRIWSHLPGRAMNSQSIAYLQHASNTNPAVVTGEGVQLPDLGMGITERVATAVKIGATSTFSRELIDDFSDFVGFVPQEIARGVVDAESNYCVNDPTAGLLSVANTLQRAAASSATPIDAIVAGINDIKVGASYATADLLVMHPTTWLDIRTIRGTTGMYVLRQNEPDELGQSRNSFFGVPVVVNTKVPLGVCIILDASVSVIAFTRMGLEIAVNWQGDSVFSTFGYQWRVVERIALAVTRPTAVCVVSGLPSYSYGAS
jgi:HK97 family phage major capsid protein